MLDNRGACMGWGLSNVLVEVARIFLGNNTHPFAQASF